MLFLTAFSFNYLIGQESTYVSNVNRYLTLDGKQLAIKYDLPSSDSTQLFDIILKIYYNNQVIQPQDSTLTGSWGSKVAPGIEKVILWDFPNEFRGDINRVTIEVVAKPISDPLAGFEYRIMTKESPFEVKFENKSRNADLYSWNFGDLKSPGNNLSTLESPAHKYKSGGTYKVELMARSSKNNAFNTIVKEVTINTGNEQDLQKHKNLKNIWLGATLASAGISAYCFLKYNSTYGDWKNEGTDELEKKYTNYRKVGIASAIVSGVCISQVIIQTKKLQKAKRTMSMNFVPLNEGGAVELVWNF